MPAVRHVLVDLARERVPISGTRLRENVHELRGFLSPEVYASFVKTVCFLGGESTGKSTLAATMAREFKTAFVAEYGRTLWEAQDGKLEFEDLHKIAHAHIRQEEIAAQRAKEFLFVDTSPLTTLIYSEMLFGQTDPELLWLSHRKYDFTFLCAPDFAFVQDGTRADDHFRRRQHQRYLELLKERQIRYALLTGSLDERVTEIKEVLTRNSSAKQVIRN